MNKINATVYALDGTPLPVFEDIDRVSYVNGESFGPGDKIGNVHTEANEARVLVINTGGFSAIYFDIQEEI